MKPRFHLTRAAILTSLIVAGCDALGATAPTPRPTLASTDTPVLPMATPAPTATPTATPAPIGGGGRIVFASDRAGDGKLNLWAINPDGTALVQLTTGFTEVVFPATSPDGSRIAFSSKDSFTWYIYLIDADGSNLTQFTDFSSAIAHWSPDGNRLIFNSDHDDEPKDTPDIWTMNIDGTGLLELLDVPADADFDASWSPDGARILFTSNRNRLVSKADLFVMNADGSNITQLTTDPENDYEGEWSPDGTRILFTSGRTGNPDVFVMNADGSNVIQLTDSRGRDYLPAWSPDGSHIVFVTNRNSQFDLYLMNADGSKQRPLTDDQAADLQPDW